MARDETALVVAPEKKRKRSDLLAARIRDLISLHGLSPGDRIPQAWLAEEEMKASKGTLREAMKALETQGLIKTRTGPGGGVFVAALSGEQAMDLLNNLFLFNQPGIADIFALRRLVEPELVADLAGNVEQKRLETLQATIRLYEGVPTTPDEALQHRLADLAFHSVLANLGRNRLMGFVCIFLLRLLRDLVERRAAAWAPDSDFQERTLDFQLRLVRLLRSGDAQGARALMESRLAETERQMVDHTGISHVGEGRE